MTNFKFTTREEYLAWRAEWKAVYKQNSLKIRKLKVEIKEKARAGYGAGPLQSKKEWLRVTQREALEILVEAKKEAARQYNERKERTK